ncbi:MAG: PaaI family thioesterase [Methanotrichaceae archaeon]|nr:PaaI family thioesterase [Methanotrichaceae archaeon]
MGYLEEIKRFGQNANPFLKFMGNEIDFYGEGKSELSMQIRPEMLNGQGWLQGGVLTSISDEAMALALYTILDEVEQIATISENTSYLTGIKEGKIIAQGWVIKKGRQVAFTEAIVRKENCEGKPLSQTRASFTILYKK